MQEVKGSTPFISTGQEGVTFAEVAQLVEHQLPKLRVAGSSPVFRSKKREGILEGGWLSLFFCRSCP